MEMTNDKKSNQQKNYAYILKATYDQSAPKVVGVYNSMREMMRGFAKSIAEEIIGNPRTGAEEEVAFKVAKTLADLIPAFFDKSYPRDEEGHIRYGNTTYRYDTVPIEEVGLKVAKTLSDLILALFDESNLMYGGKKDENA